jgi:hypothetical protein
MSRRSLRSNKKKDHEPDTSAGGFEEESMEDETAASSSSSEEEEVVPPPPLAPNRSRRANAGNLMAKLLAEKEVEKAEGDEIYESLWGGFKDVSLY